MLFGAYLAAIGINYSRMEDEYFYTKQTLRVLFLGYSHLSDEIIEEQNKILYIHINRYLVARSYTPSFFTEEIDSWMCTNFSYPKEDLDIFKSFIVKDGLNEYINEKLAFCPFGAPAAI